MIQGFDETDGLEGQRLEAYSTDNVLVIIPARDEAETLAGVIQALQRQGLNRIRVVDNGSRDRTPDIAAQ
ncbi:MAG: glycosyltransferase, partial [Cyanobacteria bacterium P01_G01_bin.38]